MNCACAAHLLIVVNIFQPCLRRWLTAEKTEPGNNTDLEKEENLPVHVHGPLEGHGPGNFWVQVVFGRSSSSGRQK